MYYSAQPVKSIYQLYDMKLLYTTAQGDLVKLKVANGTYMQIPR